MKFDEISSDRCRVKAILKLTLVNITIHHKISMSYQTSVFNSNIYVIWNVVWLSYKDLKIQGKQIIRKKKFYFMKTYSAKAVHACQIVQFFKLHIC